MAVLLPSKPENLQNASHFHPVTQHNGFSEKLCQRLLLLFWRLCCVTRTPPAAVSGHLSPLGAHLRQGDADPWYERKTRGCRGREKVERNTETARDARRTPSALFNPKPEPLVAQHDTEGGRFASVLQTTRVANSEQPSPSTEIKIGYQGIGCVRGGKAEEKALRHNATRRSLNHSYRGEICGHLEVHNRC